jgi:hypothetical protein
LQPSSGTQASKASAKERQIRALNSQISFAFHARHLLEQAGRDTSHVDRRLDAALAQRAKLQGGGPASLSQLQARNAKPVDWAQASEQEENVRYANTPQIKLRHQILSHLKEAERLKGQLQALQAQKNPAAAGMADSVLQRLMAHEQAAERLQAAQAKLPPLPGTDIGTRGHMSLMTEAEKKLPSQNAAQNRAQMLADIPMPELASRLHAFREWLGSGTPASELHINGAYFSPGELWHEYNRRMMAAPRAAAQVQKLIGISFAPTAESLGEQALSFMWAPSWAERDAKGDPSWMVDAALSMMPGVAEGTEMATRAVAKPLVRGARAAVDEVAETAIRLRAGGNTAKAYAAIRDAVRSGVKPEEIKAAIGEAVRKPGFVDELPGYGKAVRVTGAKAEAPRPEMVTGTPESEVKPLARPNARKPKIRVRGIGREVADEVAEAPKPEPASEKPTVPQVEKRTETGKSVEEEGPAPTLTTRASTGLRPGDRSHWLTPFMKQTGSKVLASDGTTHVLETPNGTKIAFDERPHVPIDRDQALKGNTPEEVDAAIAGGKGAPGRTRPGGSVVVGSQEIPVDHIVQISNAFENPTDTVVHEQAHAALSDVRKSLATGARAALTKAQYDALLARFDNSEEAVAKAIEGAWIAKEGQPVPSWAQKVGQFFKSMRQAVFDREGYHARQAMEKLTSGDVWKSGVPKQSASPYASWTADAGSVRSGEAHRFAGTDWRYSINKNAGDEVMAEGDAERPQTQGSPRKQPQYSVGEAPKGAAQLRGVIDDAIRQGETRLDGKSPVLPGTQEPRLKLPSLGGYIRGEKTLPDAGKRTVQGAAEALQRVAEREGAPSRAGVKAAAPEELSQALSEVASDEAVSYLRLGKDYPKPLTEDPERVDHVLSQVDPESTVWDRKIFHVLSSILSVGQTAQTEGRLSIEAWLDWRRTGEIPLDIPEVGPWNTGAGHRIVEMLTRLHKLAAKCGNDPERLVEWLSKTHTLKELRKISPEAREDLLDPAKEGKYYGFSAFGRKVGNYGADRLGSDLPVADRWEHRGANRQAGQLVEGGKRNDTRFISGDASSRRALVSGKVRSANELGMSAVHAHEVSRATERHLYECLGIRPRGPSYMKGLTDGARCHGIKIEPLDQTAEEALRAKSKGVDETAIRRGTLEGYGQRAKSGQYPLPGDPGKGEGVILIRHSNARGMRASTEVTRRALKRLAQADSPLSRQLIQMHLRGRANVTTGEGGIPTLVCELDGARDFQHMRMAGMHALSSVPDGTVIPFKTDMDGHDALYSFTLKGVSSRRAAKVLESRGIHGYTLTRSSGGVRVVAFDRGALRAKEVMAVLDEYDCELSAYGRGTGVALDTSGRPQRLTPAKESQAHLLDQIFGKTGAKNLSKDNPNLAFLFVIPGGAAAAKALKSRNADRK